MCLADGPHSVRSAACGMLRAARCTLYGYTVHSKMQCTTFAQTSLSSQVEKLGGFPAPLLYVLQVYKSAIIRMSHMPDKGVGSPCSCPWPPPRLAGQPRPCGARRDRRWCSPVDSAARIIFLSNASFSFYKTYKHLNIELLKQTQYN